MPERVAELREWAVDTMLRMVEVLRPIIKDLQPLAEPDGEEGEPGEVDD